MTTHVTLIDVWHEAEIAIALGVGSWVMLFPVKTFVRKVVGAWNEQENLLKEVREELVTQRTNCLNTLQNNGKQQLIVLEKMAGSLEGLHGQQTELVGYIKGLADGSRRV